MTVPARDREAELTAAIDRGEPGSWLVYTDWCELQGGHPTVHPALEPDAPVNGAAPIPHAELFEGIWLYERLTNIHRRVCHGPTNTTLAWAYRGLWHTTEVMVFRPGDAVARLDNRIAHDAGPRALHPRPDWPPSTWAMVAAPPGVRLRALAVAVSALDEVLPDNIVFEIVAQTAAAGPSDCLGDTFVGWDGSLWFSPSFPRVWYADDGSDGRIAEDSLVVDNHFRLAEVLAGQARREHALDSHVAVPANTGRRVCDLLQEFFGPYRPHGAEWFVARCCALARQSTTAALELGELARATFPQIYARQRAALSTAGIDIDQPWILRAPPGAPRDQRSPRS